MNIYLPDKEKKKYSDSNENMLFCRKTDETVWKPTPPPPPPLVFNKVVFNIVFNKVKLNGVALNKLLFEYEDQI